MLSNHLKSLRVAAGLTQAELAARAGVSRQLVGSIEAGRHLPRVDAGMALASALGVDVSRLFQVGTASVDVLTGERPAEGSGVRLGWVGDRVVTAPARLGGDGWDVADAVVEHGRPVPIGDVTAGAVVAGCEPGLETLEHQLRQGGIGAISIATSSASAIEALLAGRVHAAVVHGPATSLPLVPPGARVVRLRFTGWRVGLSVPRNVGSGWWQDVLDGSLLVVQRESRAAVQQTFEQAVGRAGHAGPRVGSHVAAARLGMAAGLPAVTIEPAALAVGADFHPLDRHQAEIWVSEQWITDRGVEQMLDAVASSRFRRRLQAVGAYDLDGMGSRIA